MAEKRIIDLAAENEIVGNARLHRRRGGDTHAAASHAACVAGDLGWLAIIGACGVGRGVK